MRCDYLHITVGVLAIAITACSESSVPPTASLKRVPAPAVHATADDDEPALDVPLAGLTADQLDRFNRGRAIFSRVFDAQGGLGPSERQPRRAIASAGCPQTSAPRSLPI